MLTPEDKYNAVQWKVNEVAYEARKETKRLEKQIENYISPSPPPSGHPQAPSTRELAWEAETRGHINDLNTEARQKIDSVIDTLPQETPQDIKDTIKQGSEEILRGQEDPFPKPTRDFFERGHTSLDFNLQADKAGRDSSGDRGNAAGGVDPNPDPDGRDGGGVGAQPQNADVDRAKTAIPEREQRDDPAGAQTSRFAPDYTPPSQSPAQDTPERPAASHFLKRDAGQDRQAQDARQTDPGREQTQQPSRAGLSFHAERQAAKEQPEQETPKENIPVEPKQEAAKDTPAPQDHSRASNFIGSFKGASHQPNQEEQDRTPRPVPVRTGTDRDDR